MLDLVTVPAPVALFHFVARVREIGDDAVSCSFGDAKSCRDVTETDPSSCATHDTTRAWFREETRPFNGATTP